MKFKLSRALRVDAYTRSEDGIYLSSVSSVSGVMSIKRISREPVRYEEHRFTRKLRKKNSSSLVGRILASSKRNVDNMSRWGAGAKLCVAGVFRATP